MKIPIAFLIYFLAVFAISGCKKDKKVSEGNLIANSTFESNGQPNFQGWTGIKSFSNDVPPDGGKWSLRLEPAWYPGEGFAETFITGLSGNYTFQLNCEVKSIRNGTGTIILRLRRENGTVTDVTKTTFNDSTWEKITLITTVQLQPADQLIVHLTAGSTEVATWFLLFDNVELTIQ